MSQSGRRGPAIFAASNQHVGLSNIAHRGQWNLESFATLMEYICETSHSDQKVGRALSGWESPQLKVHAPTLRAITSTSAEESKVHDFVNILFRSSMHKIIKPSFAHALVATLLMYIRETMKASSGHTLHLRLIEAASVIFVFDDNDTVVQKLLYWGERIRSQFIMDNLTQFKTSTILENLSEDDISANFVGANTFADALNKMICGYRCMTKEILELRQNVLELVDTTKSLAGIVEKQHATIIQVVSQNAHTTSSGSEPMPNMHPAATKTLVLQQVRTWPQNLQSLNGLQLSTLIYEYIGQRLDMIPRQPNNKAQGEVMRAIAIAAKFEPRLTQLRQDLGVNTPSNSDLNLWRELALSVENRVLTFINKHKPDKSGSQRVRSHTGRVPSIVRTWKTMNLDSKI